MLHIVSLRLLTGVLKVQVSQLVDVPEDLNKTLQTNHSESHPAVFRATKLQSPPKKTSLRRDGCSGVIRVWSKFYGMFWHNLINKNLMLIVMVTGMEHARNNKAVSTEQNN